AAWAVGCSGTVAPGPAGKAAKPDGRDGGSVVWAGGGVRSGGVTGTGFSTVMQPAGPASSPRRSGRVRLWTVIRDLVPDVVRPRRARPRGPGGIAAARAGIKGSCAPACGCG